MTAPVCPHINLNPSMGATFVGVIVASVLYGITILQTVYYYATFTKDDMFLKVMVAILWILDTVALMINCHGLYWYVITNWGNPLILNDVVWSFTANVFFTNTIALIVQLYLIRRVYILSQRKWQVPGFLVILALLAFSSGIAYGARLAQLGLNSLLPKILFLIRTSLAATLVVDVLITISLSWYLHQSRTGMKSTDSIINFLIIYTVNTGLLTSLAAFMDVVLHSALDGTLAYLTFYVMLTKLYTNSFLGTLNARTILRGKGTVVQSAPSADSNATAHNNNSGTGLSKVATVEMEPLPPMRFKSRPLLGDVV